MGSRSALSQQQWFSLWFCCGSLIIKARRSFILPVISKCWNYAFAATDTSLISWLSWQVNNERRILLRPAPTIHLRACLHGMGDPGPVGLVSFVFTLWGTQHKRNLPTRPGSPTPCKQGLSHYTIGQGEKFAQEQCKPEWHQTTVTNRRKRWLLHST